MHGEDYRSNATSSASGIPTAPGITPTSNPRATLRVVVPRRSQYSQSRGRPRVSNPDASLTACRASVNCVRNCLHGDLREKPAFLLRALKNCQKCAYF